MRFNKTIDHKFSHVEDKQADVRKPAVSVNLRAFLQNESIRIDNVIAKKKMHNQMLKKIAEENLTYRERLRSSIEEAQEKHQANREKFLEKRVKGEKFKMDEVQRRRTALFQKIREKKRANEETFRKNRSQTVDFWKTKQLITKKSYQSQGAVPHLFEDAVSRKKFIQRRNETYADQEKDKLFARHSEVGQRIQKIVAEKRKILEEYDEKLEDGYYNNLDILDKKQQKYINSICFHKDRSQSLLKSNKAAYIKKMQGRLIDYRDNIQKKRQNYTSRNMKRAQSMKQCRCHKKGSTSRSPQYGMTQSITLNEQQGKSPLGLNTKRSTWSVGQARTNFMMQSQTNLSTVKNNQSLLRDRQDLKDERKLMTQKQITDAIKTREDIKNQSNLLVRQARVLA